MSEDAFNAMKLLSSRFANHLLKHMQTCDECKFDWYKIFAHMMEEEKDWIKYFENFMKTE